MYFDAVVSNDHAEVLFNGTPAETYQFVLKNKTELIEQGAYVMDGKTLKVHSFNEYLLKG